MEKTKHGKAYLRDYGGYRIKVYHNPTTKGYDIVISQLSKNAENIFDKKLLVNEDKRITTRQNACKYAKKIIDEHSWDIVCEKDDRKLFVRLSFEGRWEYKIEGQEVFSGTKPTREEAVFSGQNILENNWQRVASYFGAIISVAMNNSGKYIIMINQDVLIEEFEDFLSALALGMRAADNIIKAP